MNINTKLHQSVTSKLRSVQVIAFALMLLGLLSFQSATAASDTWTGAGGDANWQTAGNWGGVAPSAGDSLNFAGSTQLTNNNNFANGTAFNGITFAGGSGAFTLNELTPGSNGILLSGQTAGITNGITNSSSVTQTVNIKLTLDWGLYTFGSGAGTTLALNGNGSSGSALTANKGGVAYFSNAGTISTTSTTALTNDSTGLISSLGGAGLMATGNAFTGLATVSGGTIAAYNYTSGAIIAAAANIGATTQGTATNIELTSTTAGNYTLANGANTTFANTILATNNTGNKLVIGSANSGTLDLGTVNGTGGIYLPNSGTSQGITIGGGSAMTLTAGNMTGTATPGTVIFAVNGTSTGNQAENNSTIKNNGSGGAVSVVKTGTGSMYFNLANTYTGGTYVDQGYLQINTATGLGAVGSSVFIAGGAELYLNLNNATWNYNFNLSPGVGVSYSQLGAIKLGGTGTDTISGTLNLLGAPAVGGAPGDRIGGSASGATDVFTGQITGTGTLELQSNAGTINNLLNNTGTANNWTGGLILDEASNDSNFTKLGASNQLASNNVTIAQSGTGMARLDMNGFSDTIGGLSSTSNANNQVFNSGAGASTLTLGAGNATATFGGVIGGGGGGALSIIKTGMGTQALTGANTYGGTTTVNGGTLVVTGAFGAGSIAVNSGGTFASNSASTMGALTMATGSTLLPGATATDGSIGTMSLTSLTINGGNLRFDLGSLGVNDLVSATGAVNFAAGSPTITALGGTTGDAYTVLTSTSAITYGVTPTLASAGGLVRPTTYALDTVSNPDALIIDVTGGGAIPITWSGANNGTWDINTTTNNWKNGSNVADVFYNGDSVTFDDNATGTRNITITPGTNGETSVAPASITVNNSSGAYTIGGDPISGGATLTKSGTSALTLNNNNTFTGGVILNAGTLNIGNAGALGSGALTIAGGTIDNTGTGGNSYTTLSNNLAQNWNSDFTFAGTNNLNLGTGAVTLGNSVNVTVNNSSTLTVGGIIGGGANALSKSGNGTLTLTATNNTFTGGVTVNGGTVIVSGTGGNSALGKGNATVNTGGTLIGSGADTFGFLSATHNSPATINIAGGTVTDLGTSNYRITLPNLNFTGGTLTSAGRNTGDAANGNSNYSFNGDGTSTTITTNASSSTAVISAAVIAAQTATTFNVASGSAPGGVDLLVSSKIVNFGVQPLTKTGAGLMEFTGANTYTGATNINGGTLLLGSAGALGGGGNVTFGSTGFSGGTLQYSASNAVDYSGKIVGSTTAISVDTNGQNVTYASNLAGTNSGGLTKVGAGTLSLNGANAYTGVTNINGGTLALGNAGALSSGNIAFGGGTLQYSASNTVDYSGRIVSSGSAISIDTNGQNVTYASALASSNTGGLTLNDTNGTPGSLTLSGSSANVYTGKTTVTSGELDLNKTAGVNAIAGTATLDVTNPDVLVNGGTLKWLANEQMGDSTTITETSGTVNLNGNTETLGDFKNSGGTFSTGSGHLIGTGATITWSGGTNTVNSGGLVEDQHVVITGGTNTVQGGSPRGVLQVDSGGTGLEMTGSTLTLNSDNANAGELLLQSGVSVASHASGTSSISNALSGSNSGFIDMSGGTSTFTTDSGSTLAISAVIQNGGLTKAGTGTLQVSGSNTYAGGTIVNAGTLQASGSGTLGSSSGTLTVNNSGSTVDVNGTNQTVGNLTGNGGTILNNATSTSQTLTIGNGNTGGGTYAGVIADNNNAGSGILALTKIGNQTISLSGVNTYSGATTLSGGTLNLTGSNVNSTTTVGNTATLAGTGTAGALVLNSGGNITPGTLAASPGSGTLAASSLTWNPGGSLTFALDPSSSATGLLNLGAGAFTKGSSGGGSGFDINFSGGATGFTYDLVNFTGGTLFTASDFTQVGGPTGSFQFIPGTGSQTDLVFVAGTVPEPSTWAMMLGGIGFLIFWARKRNRQTVL